MGTASGSERNTKEQSQIEHLFYYVEGGLVALRMTARWEGWVSKVRPYILAAYPIRYVFSF